MKKGCLKLFWGLIGPTLIVFGFFAQSSGYDYTGKFRVGAVITRVLLLGRNHGIPAATGEEASQDENGKKAQSGMSFGFHKAKKRNWK